MRFAENAASRIGLRETCFEMGEVGKMLPALDLSGKVALVIGGASGTPGNSGETFATETLLLRTPWVATWSLRQSQ